jgi:hypothetical protein
MWVTSWSRAKPVGEEWEREGPSRQNKSLTMESFRRNGLVGQVLGMRGWIEWVFSRWVEFMIV